MDNFKLDWPANCPFLIFIHEDIAETKLTDFLPDLTNFVRNWKCTNFENHKWKWLRLQKIKSLANLKSLDNFKLDWPANCRFLIFIHKDTAETKLTDFLIWPILSETEKARILKTTNESDLDFKKINRLQI